MERLKQFSAAVVALALALIAAVVGVLALTVWKPAEQIVATTTPDEPYVMTRDGVLPLYADGNVTVSVTAGAGQEVSLVLGTTSDVLGWIGDSPYTEVVGIKAGMTELKTVDHPSVAGGSKPDTSQSGGSAQSGDVAQSGGVLHSGGTAQSGAVPTGNDMWLEQTSGTGSATLDLKGMGAGRSVLATVDGTDNAPALTLTWAVHHTNVIAIVSFLLAGTFLLATLGFFLTHWQVVRHRARRAAALAERAAADTTETSQIDLSDIRAMAAQKDEPSGYPEGDAGLEGPTVDTGDEAAPEKSEPEGAAPEGPTPEEATPGGSGPTEEPHEGDVEASVQVEHEDAQAAASPVPGRHGSQDHPADQDPPERVSTDSGVIDLSSVRPGAALPSRRALREARERGEGRIFVDGQEFDTGLIPIVGRPGTVDPQTVDPQTVDPQTVDPQTVDPQVVDPQTVKPQAGEASGDGSEWTSVLKGWRRRLTGGGK